VNEVDTIFRREAGRLVPYLLRRLGPKHFDLAEDAVQDAFVEAVRRWPIDGAPRDPRAWLLKAAHRKALDRLKRAATARDKAHLLDAEAFEIRLEPARDMTDEVAVLLLACDPGLSPESRVALTLRTVSGLTTREVARALLTQEATIAQRIVRAKREIERRGVTPLSDAELDERIASALDVLYLVFNEGHHASEGSDLVRHGLIEDALFLASALAGSPSTDRPAVHALIALMLFASARLAARTDEFGDVVLLEDQDRARWDRRRIALAFGHLELAARGSAVSRFHLEAEIASVHASAGTAEATDWERLLRLYEELERGWPSPIIALNRAVVVLRARGPAEAERALRGALADPALARYAPAHAVAAEIARVRGDAAKERAALERALACPGSEPQKRFLRRRLEAAAL
jgi:RNA polymerase sigma-70 factor (ECF subfamily)